MTIFFFHILFTLKFSWSDDDIYPEDSNNEPSDFHTGNFTGLSGESAYSPENNIDKVYVKDCFFSSFSNRSIYFEALSSYSKTLIELSTFDNCSSSQQRGGCIYQSNGNFVMNKCCGVRCYSTNRFGSGHFVCTQIFGNKNSALDSSMSLCYNVELDSGIGQAALFLRNGSIIVKTVNISKNKCSYASAFIFNPSPNETSSVSFASINENNATAYAICYFDEKAKNHEFLYSNIINNECNSSTNGMIFTYSPLYIKHCCMLDNNAPIWFEGNGATITIIDCTIKEEYITNTTGSVTTNGDSWKAISSFINAIKCTEDVPYCEASYDSAGGLTANLHSNGMKTYDIYKYYHSLPRFFL